MTENKVKKEKFTKKQISTMKKLNKDWGGDVKLIQKEYKIVLNDFEADKLSFWIGEELFIVQPDGMFDVWHW